MTKKKKYGTLGIVVIVALIYAVGLGLLEVYRYYTSVNVVRNGFIYISTGASFDDVLATLKKGKFLKDERAFVVAAKRAGYAKIRSGKYRLTRGMRNRTLIRVLQTGQQVPVNLTIAGNIRDGEKLAGIISHQIEPDSVSLLAALNDKQTLKEYGFTPQNILSLFIPNTYEVYWNLGTDGLFKRMKREYDNFWNEQRTKKLTNVGLSREEAIIVASIVNEETNKVSEMPRIAGVYINRLNKKMKLDADPTVKFAVNDFTLKRVLDKHTAVDSPYNTYKYAGVPPGPICIPSIAAIDAVLNYEKHDYYYFCAKTDFSGYHVFSKTLAQHNQYANSYRNALNNNKIY